VEGSDIKITAAESRLLLDLLKDKPEFDLQCLSKDSKGYDLLTAFIPKSVFIKMLKTWEKHYVGYGTSKKRKMILTLKKAICLPAFKRVDSIMFQGRKLSKKNQRYFRETYPYYMPTSAAIAILFGGTAKIEKSEVECAGISELTNSDLAPKGIKDYCNLARAMLCNILVVLDWHVKRTHLSRQ